jgi:molybdopterin-binding protein
MDRQRHFGGQPRSVRPQGDRRARVGRVLAKQRASTAAQPLGIGSSARNRLVGLVTDVLSDKVMTRVEMQCGPHTVVSLMSTEAAREVKLEPGSLAVAVVVKATNVIVETPDTPVDLGTP